MISMRIQILLNNTYCITTVCTQDKYAYTRRANPLGEAMFKTNKWKTGIDTQQQQKK